jgi:prevent-host-death family protein
MKTKSAKDAKNGFGLLIDTALVEPVTIEKHGRSVVVVVASELYAQLVASSKKLGPPQSGLARGTRKGR